MSRRAWYGFGALIGVCFIVSVYLERRPALTVPQAVAHERTRVAVVAAAKAETTYKFRKDTVWAGRDSLRTLSDSLLAHPADTVKVKEYVTRTDRVLVKDSLALLDADRVIAAQKIVIASKDTELVLARQPPSRFRTTVAALYDPIASRYSGSADASFRVIGGWALIARVDTPVGERPKAQLGISLAFQ